jgi:methylenetetrahydrofolate dehydrogenase (NADP+)/methenyltetrahydrofolate cyclohydrolase
METRVLNGREIQTVLAEELAATISLFPRAPALAIVQVGERPESDAYIRQKVRFGQRVGFEVNHIRLGEQASDADVMKVMAELNGDDRVDGIILQLPLPAHMNTGVIIESIHPLKDVDGLTSASVKRLFSGDTSGFVPATAKGILTLLDRSGIEVAGTHAVIVGRSNLVGKPVALALLSLNATVTLCHSGTADLAKHTRSADILIVAAGKRGLIGREHVSRGQTVIDVGITADPLAEGKRKLLGDVDFDAVKEIVGAITPVPGGVGPLTVASLFENVAAAFERLHEK